MHWGKEVKQDTNNLHVWEEEEGSKNTTNKIVDTNMNKYICYYKQNQEVERYSQGPNFAVWLQR